MRRRVVSTPLPPGVLELREVVNVLDGGNGWTLLRVEWGGTRGRDSVVFLPAGVTDELMGERGTSATDDLMTPVPRWAKRPLGRLGMIHFWAWQLYLHGINNGAHQWKRQDNEWKTERHEWDQKLDRLLKLWMGNGEVSVLGWKWRHTSDAWRQD